MSESVNFCPECHSEYRAGFTRCSDCDVELVSQLGSEEEDGGLVALTRQRSFEMVAELLDRLEQEEIPYVIEAGTGLHLLDGEVVDEPRPRDWEARVFVAASFDQRAREVLEDVTRELRAQREAQPSES